MVTGMGKQGLLPVRCRRKPDLEPRRAVCGFPAQGWE